MPNGDDGVTLDGFAPSWLEDGLGIMGEQTEVPQLFDEDWDTNSTTDERQNPDFSGSGGAPCIATAGNPPAIGTWVLGSVGGVCQWIDTTTC